MNTAVATIGEAQADQTNPRLTKEGECSLSMFTVWMEEIREQPRWRTKADREADYYDGNQLDSEILRRQAEIGMPPAIEPLIGPTIDAVLGMEAKSRQDWRVLPDGEAANDEVAEALNFKLNQAEKKSEADRSCSEAYASQIKVGLGWVEVSRNTDPFQFPYRTESIHRNEIFWDFLSKRPDLSDARYLVRRRWTDRTIAELMFPDKAELIRLSGTNWSSWSFDSDMTLDGGQSTDLAMAQNNERGWSIEEQEWRDQTNRRVCLFEVWYRNWVRVMVLKTPDGRVVEYDKNNQMHQAAVGYGIVKPTWAIIGKMRRAYFMGPHKLSDGPTPYRHNKFPYVAFWGKREDRTNVPYGLVRGMMYLQDEVNARISKMQWGLSAFRVIRTAGVVAGTDEQFRREVGRLDADIILNREEMGKNGAKFEVESNFELNAEQANRLADAREGIKRTGGIYNSFMGQDGQAKSGVAISGLVEQSTQTLADINDNFKYARAEVGDLLVSLIIEDMIGVEQDVFIPGNGLKEDKTIRLNTKTYDPTSGIQYLNNDIERTKLKVVLDEVPSTPTYRAQQLTVMGEAYKSMPAQYQVVMLPYLLNLMDIPDKRAVIEAIKAAESQQTPEQIQQMIDEAVDQALLKANIHLKQQEIDLDRLKIKGDLRNNNITAEARWQDSETKALALDKERNNPEKPVAANT